MDSIPFEKVTVQQAKAAADGPAERRVERNWAASRQKDGDQKTAELTDVTWAWLDSLPPEVQPGALVQQYPRIANKLAEVWKRRLHCERYLDALVLDTRGDRQGFPADVTAELARLKIHFISNVMTQHYDNWGGRVGF